MLRFKGHFYRLAFAATLVLSLLALLPSAFAQVTVRGNSRVDRETIRSYFAGSDDAAVNQGVKDLYATGLFSDVRVSRGGGGVVITVNENKIINRVAFEGNSKVKARAAAGGDLLQVARPLQPLHRQRRHRAHQGRVPPRRPRRRLRHVAHS